MGGGPADCLVAPLSRPPTDGSQGARAALDPSGLLSHFPILQQVLPPHLVRQ